MVTDFPKAGNLNTVIEFFENSTVISSSGVPNKEELIPLGKCRAERIDSTGTTDEAGRLADEGLVTYRLRFDADLFLKGGALVIRDFDGDYNIRGPFQLINGRRRYMQCRTIRRA